MILMPIVYVSDMEDAVRFYESLGFGARSRSPKWTELRAGEGAILALHHADTISEPSRRMELSLVATEPLEQVASRFENAVVRPIADEAFGRSLVLRDPDGLRIQVNEHDPGHHPKAR